MRRRLERFFDPFAPFRNTFSARLERRQRHAAYARDAAGLGAGVLVVLFGLERLMNPGSRTGAALGELGGLLLLVLIALWIGCAIAGRRFPFDPRR